MRDSGTAANLFEDPEGRTALAIIKSLLKEYRWVFTLHELQDMLLIGIGSDCLEEVDR